MPRTKATNRVKTTKQSASATAAIGAKRTRDSVTEEAMANALRELDGIVESRMFELSLDYDQRSDQVRNLFKDIRQQLGPSLLAMKLGDVAAHGANATNATMCSVNSTVYGGGAGGSGKRMTRDDEGYLTEESNAHSSTISSTVSRSARPLGPLASAKAKSRRSRSAQNTNNTTTAAANLHNATGASNHSNMSTASTSASHRLPAHGTSTLQRSASQHAESTQHQSRSKYRTPGCSRLQTMSAERQQMMAPVTPKMQLDRPLAMLRYQKIGETVISLSGSPVIAQGVTREGANINIPVPNGVISVLPSAMSSVEPNFMSQLDPETLRQLRMLQSNLNLMMSQVKD